MGARVSTIGSRLLAGQMSRRSFLKAAAVFGGAAVTGTLAAGCRRQAAGPTKLVVLTHWGAQPQKDVLEPIFKKYQEENPRIQIEHQTVDFGELLNRITTGRLGGVAPDVYHFYNLWLPKFVASDLLQVPPDNVINEIRQGYSESTVNGVTYRGRIWGVPDRSQLLPAALESAVAPGGRRDGAAGNLGRAARSRSQADQEGRQR